MSFTKGFSYLVGLQLFSRIITFALNTLLARDLGPQWYAIANVHLYVIGSTALFLAKEGLRRAGQRIYPGGAGAALRHGINVAWFSVPTTASHCVRSWGVKARRRGAGEVAADTVGAEFSSELT